MVDLNVIYDVRWVIFYSYCAMMTIMRTPSRRAHISATDWRKVEPSSSSGNTLTVAM